jgi:hypothetical protein
MTSEGSAATGHGSQTNAEWVARLNVGSLLGAAKNLIDVAQNLTGPHPNGYAAASVVQQIGEFLTLHARPVGEERDVK